MLTVVMLSVIILSVVASFYQSSVTYSNTLRYLNILQRGE